MKTRETLHESRSEESVPVSFFARSIFMDRGGNDNYAMMSTLGNSNSLFKYKSFSIFARGTRNLLFIRHARRTFEYFVDQNRLYTRAFIF